MSHSTSTHYLLHSGKNSKFLYYAGAVLRGMIPDVVMRARLQGIMSRGAELYDPAYVADRVDYYCKINHTVVLPSTAQLIGTFSKRGNSGTYYYDCCDVVRYFDPKLRWCYLFGDVRDIPPYPSIVKSRSLVDDNANSVLLKLNRVRHYVFVDDNIPFEQKQDLAIYRGQVGTRENRIRFVQMYGSHPRVDAANTLAKGGLLADNPDGKPLVPRLSLYDHLRYRYIMTLEGNDVASNLKWVMSSRSLAVMPRPTCETWFMEGRLVAGVHYVEVRPDYADLIEKMDYYSSHFDEAKAIADNANAYVNQFRDRQREQYISLRVMEKYLSLVN